MRGFYLEILDRGAPLAVKAANIAASALLVLIVALPILAVAARVVA